MTANTVANQLVNTRLPGPVFYSQNLTFLADHKNIGLQYITQDFTYVIENNHIGIIIMKKLIDLSSFV